MEAKAMTMTMFVVCASVLTQFYLNVLKSRIRNATLYGEILSRRYRDAAHIQEGDVPVIEFKSNVMVLYE